MVTILALLGVVLVLFLAAVLATREGPVMADAPQDAADVNLPDGPVQPEDLQTLRFGMAPRGYRMSEVDRVLDRLAAELADRDRRLAELTGGRVQGSAAGEGGQVVEAPAPPVSTPVSAPSPATTPAASVPVASPPARSGGDLPPGARH